ncbi:MAG TPA: hypothetical protein VG889_07460 [Rhizomicrobium sp.]|nr:hypothetical protein [Rhizomicrobium sp.]
MKIVIIVLVVVAVAFAFVAIRGGTGGPSSGDGAPPTKSNGEVDEDRLADWKQPDFAAWMAKAGAAFAPKIKLDKPVVTLAQNGSDTRFVPSSSDKMRVAKIAITAGIGVRITYSCVPKDGRQCGKSVCICREGATLSDFSGCPDAWADKHDGRVCSADDAKTSLVVYPESAPIQFTALGPSGATAEVQ